MFRNYLLLLMFLAGALGILNSCADIPDESPNSVKVSLGVSDPAQQSRNLGRSPFRSNAALELTSTDQGVAYLFQASIVDLTQVNDSDPRKLAYSYGDYTRTSGLSGSAELTAPIGEEVFVAVVFSNAQGQEIGLFFTQRFTLNDQIEITVQIDQVFFANTTSGEDNNTTTDNSSIDNSTQQNPVLDLNIDFNFDSTSPSSLSGVLDNSSVTGISADFTTNYNSTITTTGTVRFEGNKIYVRQFGTYYPQIEISTDKEISFEGLSFDHYHNHNSCCGSYGGYDVNINLDNSTDNSSIADFRAETSTHGVRDNHTVSSSGDFFAPGNYTLRWIPSGLYGGKTSTNGDFFVVDNISLSLKYKP